MLSAAGGTLTEPESPLKYWAHNSALEVEEVRAKGLDPCLLGL